MTNFIDRIKTEIDELKDKLLNLRCFIDSPEFQVLEQEDRTLLLAQAGAMQAYLHLLGARLRRLEP